MDLHIYKHDGDQKDLIASHEFRVGYQDNGLLVAGTVGFCFPCVEGELERDIEYAIDYAIVEGGKRFFNFFLGLNDVGEDEFYWECQPGFAHYSFELDELSARTEDEHLFVSTHFN